MDPKKGIRKVRHHIPQVIQPVKKNENEIEKNNETVIVNMKMTDQLQVKTSSSSSSSSTSYDISKREQELRLSNLDPMSKSKKFAKEQPSSHNIKILWNRFAIQPGPHWDGHDLSNGF